MKEQATHIVINTIYPPSDSPISFRGSVKECQNFVEQQGGIYSLYQIVPIKHLF